MKNNKAIKIISIIVLINVIAVCWLGGMVYQLNKTILSEENIKYVMYVGTNDKDTYEQVIPTNEAKKIIDKICVKYVDAYTVQDAKGFWTDARGITLHENGVICYFYDADSSDVYNIADEIIEALNQDSVLIEKNYVVTDLYTSGSK